jgi:hypothetical protein
MSVVFAGINFPSGDRPEYTGFAGVGILGAGSETFLGPSSWMASWLGWRLLKAFADAGTVTKTSAEALSTIARKLEVRNMTISCV